MIFFDFILWFFENRDKSLIIDRFFFVIHKHPTPREVQPNFIIGVREATNLLERVAGDSKYSKFPRAYVYKQQILKSNLFKNLWRELNTYQKIYDCVQSQTLKVGVCQWWFSSSPIKTFHFAKKKKIGGEFIPKFRTCGSSEKMCSKLTFQIRRECHFETRLWVICF